MAIEQLSTATTHHNAHFFFRTGWINCGHSLESYTLELHLHSLHFRPCTFRPGIEPSSVRRCIGNSTSLERQEVVPSHCHSCHSCHSHSQPLHCLQIFKCLHQGALQAACLCRGAGWSVTQDFLTQLMWTFCVDLKWRYKFVYFYGLSRRRDQRHSPRGDSMSLLTEFLAAQKTGALLSTSDCSPARRICHWADIAAMAAMAVLFSIHCDSQEDAIRETQAMGDGGAMVDLPWLMAVYWWLC